MKIVINTCYGGFGISRGAELWLRNNFGMSEDDIGSLYFSSERSNIHLVECVETLKELASGEHARLKVVEIPDEATDWAITEYDGAETVIYVDNGKIYRAGLTL